MAFLNYPGNNLQIEVSISEDLLFYTRHYSQLQVSCRWRWQGRGDGGGGGGRGRGGRQGGKGAGGQTAHLPFTVAYVALGAQVNGV